MAGGSLKDTLCPFETWQFSTKIKGNHHLQGNVQVYDVRIPALAGGSRGLHFGFPKCVPFGGNQPVLGLSLPSGSQSMKPDRIGS